MRSIYLYTVAFIMSWLIGRSLPSSPASAEMTSASPAAPTLLASRNAFSPIRLHWLEQLESLPLIPSRSDIRAVGEPTAGVALAKLCSHGLEHDASSFLSQSFERPLLDEVVRQARLAYPTDYLQHFAALRPHADSHGLVTFLLEISGDDGARMQRLIDQSNLETKHPGISAFIDPKNAIDEALKIKAVDKRLNHIGTAYRYWAQLDPEAAWNHWKETLTGAEANAAAYQVFQARYYQPEKLFKLREELMRYLPNADDEILTRLGSSWGARDLPAALEGAKQLSLGGARETFLKSIVNDERNDDPQLLLENLPPGSNVRKLAFDRLVMAMAMTDLGQCEDWVLTLSDKDERALAEDLVFKERERRHPTETTSTVVHSREAVIESLSQKAAKRWLHTDEGNPLALLGSLEDSQLQSTVVWQWFKRDPEAALAEVENLRRISGMSLDDDIKVARRRLEMWKQMRHQFQRINPIEE